MKALLVLKDLQPNRPDKPTYLANHKKTGCGRGPSCRRGPSCQPLHVQYSYNGSRSLTTLTTPRREHQGGGRRRGLGRGRHGAGEDAAVDAHAERSTRVHWFGCGVRLPSPQGLASGGSSRGDEASSAAHPATRGRSRRSPRRWFGRLVQEEQRLKKQQDRSIQIQQLLLLELFVD